MITLTVYNKDLYAVGVVDAYKSLIWANRYNELGDCEVYVPATDNALSILKMGYYLSREDDDMVCQIRKVEVKSSVEEGDYIAVTGIDAKALLDQRIVWGAMYCAGNVEEFCRQMVDETCITPEKTSRKFLKEGGGQLLYLGTLAGLEAVQKQQMSYCNVGEKIREFCKTYKYGYRFRLNNGAFYFEMFQGTDKSGSVVFSKAYDNLSESTYVEDNTEQGNVAIICGEGAGIERSRSTYGFASGVDRHEVYVDARNTTRTMTYKELTAAYPLVASGGSGYVSGLTYCVGQLDVQIIDGNQRTWISTEYPDGQFVTISGVEYYRLTNIAIADLALETPSDDTACKMRDVIYSAYLFNAGAAALQAYGEKKSFEGQIIPDVTFVYRRDYGLGDIITVRTEFGEANARVLEVVECEDDTGYKVEPKFAYTQTAGQAAVPSGQEIGYETGSRAIADGTNAWDQETGTLIIRNGLVRIMTSNSESDYITLNYDIYQSYMQAGKIGVRNIAANRSSGLWFLGLDIDGAGDGLTLYRAGQTSMYDDGGIPRYFAAKSGMWMYDTDGNRRILIKSADGTITQYADDGTTVRQYLDDNAGLWQYDANGKKRTYLGYADLFLYTSAEKNTAHLSASNYGSGGSLVLKDTSEVDRMRLLTDGIRFYDANGNLTVEYPAAKTSEVVNSAYANQPIMFMRAGNTVSMFFRDPKGLTPNATTSLGIIVPAGFRPFVPSGYQSLAFDAREPGGNGTVRIFVSGTGLVEIYNYTTYTGTLNIAATLTWAAD